MIMSSSVPILQTTFRRIAYITRQNRKRQGPGLLKSLIFCYNIVVNIERLMTIQELKSRVEPILKANGVEYAAVFGSAARGTARSNSDVDLLIRYKKSPGLIKHIGLAYTLQDQLQKKVDLITERSLRQEMAPFVKKDLKILYGTGIRPDLS